MRSLVFALALASAAAPAAGVSADDLAAIREAIERHALEKSPDCAVHRPASMRFSDVVLMGAEVVQQVHVTDRAGVAWIAYYAMQRREDGGWRASGCRVVQPSRTISA